VIRHNQKLKKKLQNSLVAAAVAEGAAKSAKKKKAPGVTSAEASNADDAEAMRDQGFCRPRLLILCPFRSTALRIVQALRGVLGENTSVSGWDKLMDEFSAPEVNEADPAETRKPEDWQALFGKNNADDDFKVRHRVATMFVRQ
jgi:U3 small nucleolar RNA-associated protein 25